MQKVNIYNIGLTRSRICRLLFVLCLVLFALYPLFDAALDAYSDHLTHPLRMTPDDRICAARHNDHVPNISALFQRVSVPAIDCPVFHFFRNSAIPVAVIRNSQSCPTVFSDLSPPVI